MSAIVCGKRSTFFEDNIPSSSSPNPVSKRIRCSSSPVGFSLPRTTTPVFNLSALDHLTILFPDMDQQILERALNECGDDIDSAIRSLNELRLGSAENSGSAASKSNAEKEANLQFQIQGKDPATGEAVPVESSPAPQKLPMDGAEWVDFFVREMMSASNIDDARSRASRALEFLEKSICDRATAEAQGVQQENLMLKEQLQVLVQENTLLKRSVSIQHERQKEFEDRSQELHNLKHMVSQYQEQLRTLEVNNYSLTMHLKQAQQGHSIPGRFHPDVF